MDHTKSRLDPRVIRTRQWIREAFIELLQEMELEKISVNRIAERASINRVTFYLHYRDIPDMLEKMAEEMIEDIRSILLAPPANAQTEPDGNWPILERLLEHIAEHAKFYKVILTTRRTPVFTERLLSLLTEMVTARIEADGSLTEAGLQKDIIIWYGSSALIGTIVSWLRHDMPYTPAFLAKQFALLRAYAKGKS